jgi:uncharacterized protein
MQQTGRHGMEYGISELGLVDHHVHPALATDLDAAEFEELITESDRPVPAGMTQFDSQLGLAIRRWCAPVLGLEPFAPAAGYLAQRAALGGAEVTRRLLRASGTSHFLVDTGYLRAGMLGLDELAGTAGARVDEIVRLETVAEQAVLAGDASADGFAGRFAESLAELVPGAVGLKSIVGYRYGPDPALPPAVGWAVPPAAAAAAHRVRRSGRRPAPL